MIERTSFESRTKSLPADWADLQRRAEASAISAELPEEASATTRALLGFIDVLHENFLALEARTLELTEEVASLRARPKGFEYRGTWRSADLYSVNDIVTHDGGAWIAREASTGKRPGTSSAFTLMVKAGRDGKDAR